MREIVDQLKQLAAKIPEIESVYPLKRPDFGKPCEPNELESFRNSIDYELPEDYREYLSICGSITAMDIFNGYALHNPDLMCRMIAAKEIPQTLSTHSENAFLLPIGSDGGGNQFLLTISGALRGIVWKWSHEIPLEEDGRIQANQLEKLSANFTEFVKRMLQDWQHFIDDDQNWKYMSG